MPSARVVFALPPAQQRPEYQTVKPSRSSNRSRNAQANNIDFRDYYKDVETIKKVLPFSGHTLSDAEIASVKYRQEWGYAAEISVGWKPERQNDYSEHHISDFLKSGEEGAARPSAFSRHPIYGITRPHGSSGRADQGGLLFRNR
jgi:hypothetical protein